MKLTIEYLSKGQAKDHVSSISIPLDEDNMERAWGEATVRLHHALMTKSKVCINIG